MNMRGRLFVQGALLPSAALSLLVVGGGILLKQALLQSIDEGLIAQAAVEGISLFDSPESPHLHLGKSPLKSQVEAFVASRAVYGPSGQRLVFDLGTAPLEEQLHGDLLGDYKKPSLRTVQVGEVAVRELQLAVRSPDELRHTLVLRSSLERLEHTVGTYYRVLGLGALLVTVLLLVVQARLSRWWAERIHNMTRHTRRVAAGDLASRPTPDPYPDEIGELTEAISRASDRLEHARIAQDRLVADAAHELRTPLAAMRAEIDVTLRRPRDVGALRETLEEVRDEVDRLNTLSTHLLDLARLQNSRWRMDPGDLRELVEAVIESQSPLAESKQVKVRLDGPAHLTAHFDRGALRQAFENVLGNALKFTPEGSGVSLRLSEAEGSWRLEVQDEGAGIPLAERAAVFEPFHRLDARVAGTGLGLAIVRDVIHGHRGRAWIADSDRGTRCCLEAPRD